MRKARKRWLAIAILVATASLLAHLATRMPPAGRPAQEPYMTIFLLDGLSQAPFERELAAGHLPHIASLISEGTYVKNGIAAFPSMTGYGFYPLITGRDAARSGVLGLRWFDRRRSVGAFRTYVGRTSAHMNGDLISRPKTIYELAREHSMSLNAYVNRGVVHDHKVGWAFMTAKFRQKWWLPRYLAALPWLGPKLAPDWPAAERKVLNIALGDLNNRPRVQWITFTSLDGYHHIYGDGPLYPQLLRHIDSLIGAYRRHAKALGMDHNRVYAVLSDHGMVQVDHNLDLWEHLTRHGVKARPDKALRLFSRALDTPLDQYAGDDAIVAVNGNTLAYVYLPMPKHRGSTRWKKRPSIESLRGFALRTGDQIDLVATILALKGVELVIARSSQGRSVEIHSSRGHAVVRHDPRGYSYRATSGDPLHYDRCPPAAELLDGKPHSPQAWLSATQTCEYPYGAVRVHTLAMHPDAGDLIVTASAGYDFGHDYEFVVGGYRGGHGGLRADQLRVPYVLCGPGIARRKRISTARAEDVGATLLAALGFDPPSGHHCGTRFGQRQAAPSDESQ